MWNYLLLSIVFGAINGEKLFFKPQQNEIIKDVIEMVGNLGEKPSFCNKLDCPDYTVVESGKGYELREYKSSHWMSTSLTGVDYKDATSTMFMRLFRYIQGNNERKEKIAMTAPVLNRFIPGPGPACESNFTMSFFLSKKVKNPPRPNDPSVFMDEFPKLRAYVGEFGGFANMDKWLKAAENLGNAIGDSSKYHTSFYYTAGYDSPFKILNRHNEVWFIAK